MKLIFSDDPKLLKNTWLKRQAPFYIKGKTIQQLEIIQEKKKKKKEDDAILSLMMNFIHNTKPQ